MWGCLHYNYNPRTDNDNNGFWVSNCKPRSSGTFARSSSVLMFVTCGQACCRRDVWCRTLELHLFPTWHHRSSFFVFSILIYILNVLTYAGGCVSRLGLRKRSRNRRCAIVWVRVGANSGISAGLQRHVWQLFPLHPHTHNPAQLEDPDRMSASHLEVTACYSTFCLCWRALNVDDVTAFEGLSGDFEGGLLEFSWLVSTSTHLAPFFFCSVALPSIWWWLLIA